MNGRYSHYDSSYKTGGSNLKLMGERWKRRLLNDRGLSIKIVFYFYPETVTYTCEYVAEAHEVYIYAQKFLGWNSL